MASRRHTLAATATLGASILAGCGILGETEFDFEEVAFAAAEPTDVGEFDEQPDATYEMGTPVWLYVAVVGAETDDVETATLGYEFSIGAPDGTQWQTITEEESWQDAEGDLILAIWRRIETAEAPEPGSYTVDITVTNAVTGEELTRTAEFTVEGGQ